MLARMSACMLRACINAARLTAKSTGTAVTAKLKAAIDDGRFDAQIKKSTGLAVKAFTTKNGAKVQHGTPRQYINDGSDGGSGLVCESSCIIGHALACGMWRAAHVKHAYRIAPQRSVCL